MARQIAMQPRTQAPTTPAPYIDPSERRLEPEERERLEQSGLFGGISKLVQSAAGAAAGLPGQLAGPGTKAAIEGLRPIAGPVLAKANIKEWWNPPGIMKGPQDWVEEASYFQKGLMQPQLAQVFVEPYAKQSKKLKEARMESMWGVGGISLFSVDQERYDQALREYTDFPKGVMGALEVVSDPTSWIPAVSVLGTGFKVAKPGSSELVATILGAKTGLKIPKEVQDAARNVLKQRYEGNSMVPDVLPSQNELMMLGKGADPGWAELSPAQLAKMEAQSSHPLMKFLRFIDPSADKSDPVNNLLLAHNRLLQHTDNTFFPIEERLRQLSRDALEINSANKVVNVIKKSRQELLDEGWRGDEIKTWLDDAVVPSQPEIAQLHRFKNAYRLTDIQDELLKYGEDLLEYGRALERLEGVPLKPFEVLGRGEFHFPQIAVGVQAAEIMKKFKIGVRQAVGAKQFDEHEKFFEMQQDGINAGYKYLSDYSASIALSHKAMMHRVADHRLRNAVAEFDQVYPSAFKYGHVAKASTDYKRAGKTLRGHEALARIIASVEKGKAILEKDVRLAISENPEMGIREAARNYRGTRLRTQPSPEGFKTAAPIQTITASERRKLGTEAFLDMKVASSDRLLNAKHIRQVTELNLNRAKAIEQQMLEDGLGLGQGLVEHPAFKGLIMPKEMARGIQKSLKDPPLGKTLNVFSKASSTSVALGTTLDIGWHFIHGLPLLALSPQVWGKTLKVVRETLFDPDFMGKLMADEKFFQATKRAADNGVLFETAGEQVAEAMAGAGMVSKGLRGLQTVSTEAGSRRLVGGVFGVTAEAFERASAAFSNGGNAARVMIFEALEPMAAKQGPEGLKQLASFVNKMTGVLSARNMGISRRQQALESLFLFAPRYLRATMALMASSLRGDVGGELARMTLARLATGGTIFYLGLTAALGQEPHLDPRPSKYGGSGGKFLSINVATPEILPFIGGKDARLGIGSQITAIARLLGHSYSVATEDPEAFVRMGTREKPFPDQPFFQFLRSRLSPVFGASFETLSGANYLGESVILWEEPSAWSKEVLASRLMPFWLEGFALNRDNPGLGGIGEIFGLRTYPVSKWGQRSELRQKFAQEKYGTDYDNLNDYQQRQIHIDNPQLKELEELARREAGRRADSTSILMEQRTDEILKATKERMEGLQKASDKWKDKVGVFGVDDPARPSEIRKRIKEVLSDFRKNMQRIDEDPKYQEVKDYFESLSSKEKISYGDFAYDEYIAEVLSHPDLEDRYGDYRYDVKERKEKEFAQRWGDDVMHYITQRLTQSRQEFPPLVREYLTGRDNPDFEAYWDIADIVLERLGGVMSREAYDNYYYQVGFIKKEMSEANPLYKQIERVIEKSKIIMRERNKTLDAFLYRFGYTSSLKNNENKTRGEETIISFG